ncbi:MAG: hypothetical protein QOC89_1897, partial [Paraburkholderia sp.]|nr:hypothetical protein [Paraburkholderia sp.]
MRFFDARKNQLRVRGWILDATLPIIQPVSNTEANAPPPPQASGVGTLIHPSIKTRALRLMIALVTVHSPP